jgi:hypothetical protein
MNICPKLFLRGLCAIASSFIIADQSFCAVDGPNIPSARHVVEAHSQLRDSAKYVLGKFVIRRTERPIPGVIDDDKLLQTIPVTHRGNIWRDGDRLRVDYLTLLKHNGENLFSQRSCAYENGTCFEYSASSAGNVLRVFAKGSVEASSSLKFVNATFLEKVDSLWGSGGFKYADLLQRPDKRLRACAFELTGADALSIVSPSEKSDAAIFLAKNPPYQFIGATNTSETNGLSLSVIRVVRTSAENPMLPSKVYEILSSGGDRGYTEVTSLEIVSGQPGEILASPINESSFRNFGDEYQVYRIGKDSSQSVGDRIYSNGTENDTVLPPGKTASRRIAVWINILIIATLVIALVVWKWYPRRERNGDRSS